MENEICPVYAAKLVGPLTLNPDEVMAVQWVELESLIRAVESTPWAFSPWMVAQVALSQEQLRQFAAESTP